MKSFMAKKEEVQKHWYLVDAKDQVLGRISTRIATILMGKHKPTYTPNTDAGDFVVVINADKVKITGRKTEQKIYQRYTGYPGGRKETMYTTMQAKHPERIIYMSVERMLPKNTISRYMIKKLKIYAGAEHPHLAQKLEPISFGH